MHNLEKFTYGGQSINMHSNAAYYCYLILDKTRKMLYSGAKTENHTNECRLLKTYFTSSTVVDFKDRLQNNKEEFEIVCVEYFNSSKDAFAAEYEFHKLHNVGVNKEFYNAARTTGSGWGAGTVLCENADGSTYRVSIHEYKVNRKAHNHISSNKMNVTIRSTMQTTKIFIKDFDETLHIKELTGKVHAYDKKLNKNVRITKELFDSDDNYVGVTSGRILAYDIANNVNVYVSKEDFSSNTNYIGVTNRKNPNAKKREQSTKKKNTLVVYSLEEKKFVSIHASIYNLNKNAYVNFAIKRLYICNNKLYTAIFKIPKLDKVSGYLTIEKEDFSKIQQIKHE